MLRNVLRSRVRILNPKLNVKSIQHEYVFDEFQKPVNMIGTIESQILRSQLTRVLMARVVAQVEEVTDDLRHKVETATNLADTSTFIHDATKVEKNTDTELKVLEKEAK